MIRIAVMFPNQADSRFDGDYYRHSHMALVREKYGPYGLVAAEVDEAVSKTGKHAAPFLAIGYMTFPSTDDFMAAFKATGKAVMADIEKFTDIEPVIQISEIHTV